MASRKLLFSIVKMK